MGRGRALWGELLALVLLSSVTGCTTARLGGPDEALTTTCAPPSELCDGVCTDTRSNHDHCGSCVQVCDANSECVNASCMATCPVACPEGSECIEAVCAPKCQAGQERCDGACVDIQNSLTHCGGCNAPCATECSEGLCKAPCVGAECACPEGQERCGEACTNLSVDPKHCGDCSTSCGELEACTGGVCVCSGDLSACGDDCVDLNSDETHCGDCVTTCSAGATCILGKCACSEEQELCDGVCTDVTSSDTHCGTCGHACSDGQSCEGGDCVAKAEDGCGGAVTDATISRLALYQAVEIDLYRDQAPVPTTSRKAPVVAGRAALVRGFVEPSETFIGRNLSLRLRLASETGERVFFEKRSIGGASLQSDLSTTFQIQVPPDAIAADTDYSVELVDCAASPDATILSQRIPESGSLALDAKTTGSVKIAFVPVSHDGNLPDTSDVTLKRYVELVERQYPITRIEYSVVESIPSGATGTNFSFGDVLENVALKRYDDDPPPDVYYYGLIKPAASFRQFCNGSCTTGVAFVVQGTGDAQSLYRAGLGVGFDEQVSYTTLPHELGHNHGRDHSPCGVDGDPNFPYQNALIGSWGYDSATQSLQNPTKLWDFMSYCTPYWISDFTYDKLATRVAGVNRVPAERAIGTEKTFWAMINTASGIRWTRSLEAVTPPGTPELAIVYDDQGDEVAEVQAFRMLISDEAGYILFVPPPEFGWAAVGPRGGPVLAY